MFRATQSLNLLIIALLLNIPLAQAVSDIRGINLRYLDSDNIQVVLSATKPFKYKYFSLPADKKANKPHRFVIDTYDTFPSLVLDDSLDRQLKNFPLLEKIRIGKNKVRDNQRFSRFVLDLTKPSNISLDTDFPSPQNFQLIIELNNKNTRSVAVKSQAGQSKKETILINRVPNPAINLSHEPTGDNKKQKTTLKQKSKIALKKKIRVMLDPGHGGRDPGAVSNNKQFLEKRITFAIARKLQALMLANPNIQPLLTRHGDVLPSLKNRLKAIHQKQADIFLSIHADSYPWSKDVHGISVYTLSSKKNGTQLARLLARKENSVDQRYGLGSLEALKNNEAKYIARDLQVKSIANASKKLADSVIKSLSIVRPVFKSSIHEGPFYVLRSAYTPSILVEVGFLSNDQEAKELAKSHTQTLIAEALYKGVLEYIHNHMLKRDEASINNRELKVKQSLQKKKQAVAKLTPKKSSQPTSITTTKKNNTSLNSKLLSKLKVIKRARKHRVIAGQTFFSISKQYNLTEKELIQKNSKYQGVIFAGDTLIIPNH